MPYLNCIQHVHHETARKDLQRRTKTLAVVCTGQLGASERSEGPVVTVGTIAITLAMESAIGSLVASRRRSRDLRSSRGQDGDLATKGRGDGVNTVAPSPLVAAGRATHMLVQRGTPKRPVRFSLQVLSACERAIAGFHR